jgi:hypothetical protein
MHYKKYSITGDFCVRAAFVVVGPSSVLCHATVSRSVCT